MDGDQSRGNGQQGNQSARPSSTETQVSTPKSPGVTAPSIELPKGGGAIRGIGEKFGTNPVTGTGSMSVPIATSPGRSGFGPQLSLSYDSGAGNGPYGFGWNLSLPAITRKTDKGLPKYFDAEESDVFLLSGAEDLVPVLIQNGNRFKDDTTDPDYTIHRYRPRIEGLFARIERWTRQSNGDVHWRSLSRDNILTIYGKDANSRIADSEHPGRIFSWLICETRDDKGNAVLYEYKPEDGAGVNLTRVHERNRGDRDDPRRTNNRYLKHIRYGNRVSLLNDAGQRPRFLTEAQILSAGWMFEVVFDYGEHDADTPKPDDAGEWDFRDDPFSTHRSGFEVRTTRLCQRVLMFHHFDGEEGVGNDCLVSSTDFTYSHEQNPNNARNPIYTFLHAVTQTGYKRDGAGYSIRSLPPVEFEYTQPVVQDTVEEVDSASMENLPVGVDGAVYQWTDLHGEGIPGILTEQADAWFYKRNVSPISESPVEFAALERVATKPNLALAGGAQFMDLAGDGQLDLVMLDGPTPGLYEHDGEEGWQPFRPFTSRLNRDMRDPNLKFIDLDGDGHADVLITEDDAFIWHASLAEEGFGPARRVIQALDEEKGPRLVFADGTQSIYLADLSGDGLTDLVRIRNSEVCYWPNLGYARFGAKVTMDHAPHFDQPDQFDHKRIRLADIDGTGTIDIIYLHRDGVRLYFNQSGNSWSEPQALKVFPRVDDLVSIMTTDLLGNGTACLVWSSPLPGDAQQPMRYVNLMGGQKPHLLVKTVNNLGAETRVTYAPSTKFYLEDKKAGRPWVTKLPFPVHVVEKVVTLDHISKVRFTSEYSYHHGYFDSAEREFRGFGRVDQIDTETFEHFVKTDASNVVEEDLHQPPVLTRTWFHTGAVLDRERILSQFADEYYQNDALTEYPLPEPELPADLSTAEWREALRACKGIALRTELYALDGSDKEAHPYSVTQNNCQVRLIQKKKSNQYAVFLSLSAESISYHYERNPADPRISHSLTLETDEYGNVLKSAAVAYPRQQVDNALPVEVQAEQAKQHIIYSETDYSNDIDSTVPQANYRLRQACETRSYELTGVVPARGQFFQTAKLYTAATTASEIAYQAVADNSLQKRLLEQARTYFINDDFNGSRPLGELNSLGLAYESYQLAFTPSLVTHIYGDKVNDALFAEGAYVHTEGDSNWWVPSGTAIYPVNAADHFYLPTGARDPFGYESTVEYDPYDLLVRKTIDALVNEVTAQHDYRILQPVLMTDPNLNRSAVETDELGMVIKIAVMGKEGAGEGDTLDDPTTYLQYELFNWINNRKPNFAHSFAREKHGADNPRWQESYSYSDGSGNEVMVKVQAEPGIAKQIDDEGNVTEVDTTPNVRWVGNGRTVLNNKGNPVKQYEPYFSVTLEYEDNPQLVELGVTPIMFYDPLDRLIKTENPNGTFSKIEFDPWLQKSFDVNDTVLQSQWYVDRGSPDPGGLEPSDREQRAAWLAAKHADTPSVQYTDSLGRAILAIEDNGTEGKYLTRTVLNTENNPLAIIDARGNTVMSYRYSIGGVQLYQDSMDAGERWTFGNVAGNPIRSWGSRDHLFRSEYDALHRPTHSWVKQGGDVEKLIGLTVYGETVTNAQDKNMRGQVFHIYDQAGLVQSNGYDFKGNLISGTRRLTKWEINTIEGEITTIDWNVTDPAGLLQDEYFETSSEVDALGRVVRSLSPNNTQIPASEFVPVYNEANLLNEVRVKLRGASTETVYVKNIDYDAKGQRQRIEYGNNVITEYEYDPLTYRLINLKTTRTSDNTTLQDLSYNYDPVGNITAIKDDAQQTVFFNNTEVLPSTSYEYDALYRLTQAKGREHAAQNNTQRDATDFVPVIGIPHPNSPEALQRYIEEYHYDGVGNILSMAHTGGADLRWKRCYQYALDSNRLLATGGAGEFQNAANPCPKNYVPVTEQTLSQRYGYDDHGNMINMPHLTEIKWDFADQMQQVDLGGGGRAFYVYDASGERVRKVIEHNGSTVEERLYLGGFEIYRKKNVSGLMLERETLHIMDDEQRIALVETKTFDRETPVSVPLPIVRYQLGNHLGSASLELDEEAQIISYEEYLPYGSTALMLLSSVIRARRKRYRYTGKERDEESGLNYYGARYYATWLGRWTAADPAGLIDGPNRYVYVNNKPILLIDPSGKDSAFSRFFKRAAGGAWGATKNFAGFIRLGAYDSWAQSFSGSSRNRIVAAQDWMWSGIVAVDEGRGGDWVLEGLQDRAAAIEQAENRGEHFKSGAVFGDTAMTAYMVGRGTVGIARGGGGFVRSVGARGLGNTFKGMAHSIRNWATTYEGVGFKPISMVKTNVPRGSINENFATYRASYRIARATRVAEKSLDAGKGADLRAVQSYQRARGTGLESARRGTAINRLVDRAIEPDAPKLGIKIQRPLGTNARGNTIYPDYQLEAGGTRTVIDITTAGQAGKALQYPAEVVIEPMWGTRTTVPGAPLEPFAVNPVPDSALMSVDPRAGRQPTDELSRSRRGQGGITIFSW